MTTTEHRANGQLPTTSETAADVYVGRDYGRHDVTVTNEMIEAYCQSIGHHNAIYSSDSPSRAAAAPALLRHSEVYAFREYAKGQPAWYLPNIYGNLHARQEFEFFAPVMVGDGIHARSFIADRYVKRGRDYVVNEVLFFDAAGAVINRGRTHQSFLRETSNEGVVVDKTREKSAERRFEVDTTGAIEEIPSLRKQITLDMCKKFSGPARNYHNDKEAAQRMGFPDVVVAGMMSVCFLSELMTERFGAGWIAGGKMAVNLVNIVWGSDVLTSRGFVREITPEGARQRAQLDIWCEKEDGTKVTIGGASAIVG